MRSPALGLEPDELSLLPFELTGKLREHEPFKTLEINMLYIGVVMDAQLKEALQLAHDEALGQAKLVAGLAGRKLGKLAAITPDIAGNAGYWSSATYVNPFDARWQGSPLAHFKPAENEVYAAQIEDLHRICTLELRFEIE